MFLFLFLFCFLLPDWLYVEARIKDIHVQTPKQDLFLPMEPNVTRTSEPTCFFSETKRSRYQPLLLRAAAPIMWGMLRHTWNIFDMWSSILAPAILNMFCFAAKKGNSVTIPRPLCTLFNCAPPPWGWPLCTYTLSKGTLFTRRCVLRYHTSFTHWRSQINSRPEYSLTDDSINWAINVILFNVLDFKLSTNSCPSLSRPLLSW